MPQTCFVPGCYRARKRQKGPVSYHRLPNVDTRWDLCRQWLRAIKHPRYDENTDPAILGGLRVCGEHFTADDFGRNLMAEMMDQGKTRKARSLLRENAVPSIFPQDETVDIEPEVSSTTVQPLSAKRSRPENLPSAEASDEVAVVEGASMERGVPNPTLRPTASTMAKRRKKEFVAGPLSSTPHTASPLGLRRLRSSALMDTSSSSWEVFDPKDSDYCPEDDSSTTTTPASSQEKRVKDDDEEEEDPTRHRWKEPKVIVYESSILELFRKCQCCGKPINETHVFYVGAQMKVRWDCLEGHSGTWSSSPEVRGMPEVNLLSAASVLFTGSTITELQDWSALMNLRMIKHTTFYDMQKSYLGPVVESVYSKQREHILIRLCIEEAEKKERGEPYTPVHLSGDGRCDSPGFSAKYCHYTMMLDATGEIVQTNLVQVTEASSSSAMEAEGFKRALDTLLDVGLQVEVVATDRSRSVRKKMREEYPEIDHQFDIWHTVKGFNSKLMAKAKKKGRGDLADWSMSLRNHLWFCSASCGGNTEELKRRWLSILYHVRDIHSWTEGGRRYRCFHLPLDQEMRKKKKWLSRDSQVYQDLEKLVCDKLLLGDLEYLGLFKHTGGLEIFHSNLLKYLPKRLHFSYTGMKERGMLAVLEHNENIVKRKQATSATGELRTKQENCKRTGRWAVKKQYVPHTHLFRETLVDLAIKRRKDTTVPYQVPTSTLDRPSLPPNIAKTPKPPKEQANLDHRSRFHQD